jgi:hypothetical protein
MTCPTKGRHVSGSILDEREAICEVGSSHERALVLAMRLSISMRKTETEEKSKEERTEKDPEKERQRGQ